MSIFFVGSYLCVKVRSEVWWSFLLTFFYFPSVAANESFPEKTCATVMAGDVNVAEALVARGLATVVIHGQNQDAVSSDAIQHNTIYRRFVYTLQHLHNILVRCF